MEDKIIAFNRSKTCFYGILVILFLWFLILNALTPYTTDDWSYMFSFESGQRIQSVSDIVPSMIAHAHSTNGRVLPHALEQLFLLAPKAVFNLVNAFVTVFFFVLLYRICNITKAHNCILLFAIFMSVWICTPDFGQIFLWQDGAINYLWSIVLSLLFLIPYVRYYTDGSIILTHGWQRGAFFLFAYFMGAYTEISSLIAILTGGCLLALAQWFHKRRVLHLPIMLASAALGYVTLLRMPAELSQKVAPSTGGFLRSFVLVSIKFRDNLFPLFLMWCVLYVLSRLFHTHERTMILSIIFSVASCAASYILAFAKFVPGRCLGMAISMAVLSCGTLAPDLCAKLSASLKEDVLRAFHKRDHAILFLSIALALAVSVCSVLGDSYHIYKNYLAYKARETQILQQIERGADEEIDLVVTVLRPPTKYCANYGLRDLSVETSDTWPNTAMAKYYGVSSIIGKEFDRS